jgi:hypothetical protein
MKTFLRILLATACFALVQPASAQAGPWKFAASLYGYLPELDGTTRVSDGGGGSLLLPSGNILDNLDFAFMGALEAHNGQWGVFSDFMYLKLSGNESIGGLPRERAGLREPVSGDVDGELRGWVWTLAGEYRVAQGSGHTVDALGGVRWFDLRQRYAWSLTNGSSGTADLRNRLADAVVGAKGRFALSGDGKWKALFYGDVGAGESDLTWQAAAGVSYAFGWGEVTGMWRYLAYELKDGSAVSDIKFNGPMVGATFRW